MRGRIWWGALSGDEQGEAYIDQRSGGRAGTEPAGEREQAAVWGPRPETTR